MNRIRAGLVLLPIALAATLRAGPARAWPHDGEVLHEGLIYRQVAGRIDVPGSGPSDQVVHLLFVDTWNDEVSFVATRPADRNETISQFAARYGVVAAINANYFDVARASCGLAVGEGEVWRDAYHHLPWGRCSDSVGFDEGNAPLFFDSYETLNGPVPDGIETVVTGMPTLVRDGAVVDASVFESTDVPRNLLERNPRTAICEHDDGRTVVLVVVEGRAPRRGREGMTGLTLARFMRHVVGCRRALALDGGGSSAMYLRGQPGAEGEAPGVVSRIAASDERRLCCHLGVRVGPERPLWSAELVERSPSPEVAAGATFDLWARFRNTGRRTWEPDGAAPVVLVTDDPAEHLSLLYLEGEWLSPASPAAIDDTTAPGEVGTFLFRAVAPTEPGIYPLVVGPVAEGIRRLDGAPVRWELNVQDPDNPVCVAP
jgi:hypothetical protein